ADITDFDRQGGQAGDFAILPDGDVVVAAVNGSGQSALARFQATSTGTSDAPSLVNLINGRLYVNGTSGNDIIRFQSTNDFGINVTVNGQLHSFGELAVRTIVVTSFGGGDYIEARDLTQLPDEPGVDFEMIIEGGDGNDVIVGHQGRDRITGGNGDDKLLGWSGNDWVSGNAQKDRVYGGDGNDIVNGNGGRERVVGEAGNDTVIGGDQPDLLLGMDGDDSLEGGGGHDRLDGGAGADLLSGGGGDDTFYTRDGFVDHLVGGKAGFDRAQVDEDDIVSAVEQLLA
ncbi:MAG: hypothetical protein QOF78_2424, partial [Phycisphaerales bacterium]|nr:hypothetical protein [Phycisphaerales bacterium]